MAESEEALQLKRRARRRLVGAIALVTFVVIILPLLLDKEPGPPGAPLDVQIPKPDSSAFQSRIAAPAGATPAAPAVQGKSDPVAGKSAAAASGSEPASRAADAKPGAPTPARADSPAIAEPAAKAAGAVKAAAAPEAGKGESPAAKADAAKPAPAAKAAAKPASPEAEKAPAAPLGSADKSEQQRAQAALRDEAWVIALDAFSDAKNVKQLRTRLSAAGVKSYTEPVKTAKGELTRVRAGPFESREAADKARAKLEAMGLKPGAVVSR